jgi:hypothetical protein
VRPSGVVRGGAARWSASSARSGSESLRSDWHERAGCGRWRCWRWRSGGAATIVQALEAPENLMRGMSSGRGGRGGGAGIDDVSR